MLMIFLRINQPTSFWSAQFCILDCIFYYVDSTNLVGLHGQNMPWIIFK